MRYVYNCVKLVLLIACLGFAGQTSAAKPIKLDYVEIGGLQFKLQENQLMFRFANDVQEYVKKEYKGAAFREANINIFLQAIDNNAVFGDNDSMEPCGNFQKCSLFNWMVQCGGGHERDILDEEELAPKENRFAPGILCQNFIRWLKEQCDVKSGDTLEWEADNCFFSLNKKMGNFEVKAGGSGTKKSLSNYLEECDLRATCACRHGEDPLTEEESSAYVFPDIAKIGKKLTPLVKALTGDRTEEKEDDLEDFSGFGDLF